MPELFEEEYMEEICQECDEDIQPNSIGEYPPLNPSNLNLCWECWEEHRIAACQDMEEDRLN